MKHRTFIDRAGFAWAGIRLALRTERSVQIQVLVAAAVAGALVWLGPEVVWWGLTVLACGLVLAAELFNTALEILGHRRA